MIVVMFLARASSRPWVGLRANRSCKSQTSLYLTELTNSQRHQPKFLVCAHFTQNSTFCVPAGMWGNKSRRKAWQLKRRASQSSARCQTSHPPLLLFISTYAMMVTFVLSLSLSLPPSLPANQPTNLPLCSERIAGLQEDNMEGPYDNGNIPASRRSRQDQGRH